ncbi:MAG: hypothetical protein QM777_12360 [Pseudorhodoferax sp.]
MGGAGALAGVADFRTLDVDDLITGNKNWGAETSVTAGTNGDGFSEMAAGAFRVNDTFAILGAVSKRNNSDYANSGGIVVQDTGQDILSGLAKAEITPNADTKITLSGLLYGNNFAANGYEQTMSNQTYSAKVDYTPANNASSISMPAEFQRHQMQYTGVEAGSPATTSTPPPTTSSTSIPKSAASSTTRASASTPSTPRAGSSVTSASSLDLTASNTITTTPMSPSRWGSGMNPTGTAEIASLFKSTTASCGWSTYRRPALTISTRTASSRSVMRNADPTFSGSLQPVGGKPRSERHPGARRHRLVRALHLVFAYLPAADGQRALCQR